MVAWARDLGGAVNRKLLELSGYEHGAFREAVAKAVGLPREYWPHLAVTKEPAGYDFNEETHQVIVYASDGLDPAWLGLWRYLDAHGWRLQLHAPDRFDYDDLQRAYNRRYARRRSAVGDFSDFLRSVGAGKLMAGADHKAF